MGDKTLDIRFWPAAGHVNRADHEIPVVAAARKRSANSARRTQNSGVLCRNPGSLHAEQVRDAPDGGREIKPPIFFSGRLETGYEWIPFRERLG